MADIEGLFKQAALPERTVEICLRGDLQARHEELHRELKVAAVRDAQSFDGGEARRVAEQIQGLEADMQASTVTFLLRALGRGRPFALQAEHPPRPDSEGDFAAGVNEDTYYSAMLRETCAEIVHPDGTRISPRDLTDEAWDAMFASLSDKQFDDVIGPAIAVSRREVAIPFSQLASVISQRSEPDSRQPKPKASRRSGSKAGSPKSSPSTSTTTPEGSSVP